jgi:REP element-mobilizing transposase RayT
MPRARRDEVFPPDENCFAHLYNRCVQGAYLCGVDPVTKIDYSHRKQWIVDRLEQLASIYLIDILAHTVLDNHLHVVVLTLPDEVKKLSDREVAIRWLSLHPGRELDEFVSVDPTESQIAELLGDPEQLEKVRARLSSPSSFMKDLCEPISRRANKEDGRAGHFWEGRFKGKRLLDMLAILVCVAYVDLNQLRAGIAKSLVESNYTSIQSRILARLNQMAPSLALSKISISNEQAAQQIKAIPRVEIRRLTEAAKVKAQQRMVLKDAWLAKLTIDPKQSVNPNDSHLSKDGLRATDKGFLHVTLEQYVKILHEALLFRPGRASPETTSQEFKDIAKSLGSSPENVSWMIQDFQNIFRHGYLVGSPETLRKQTERNERKWTLHCRKCKLFYSEKNVEYDKQTNKYRRAIPQSDADQMQEQPPAK